MALKKEQREIEKVIEVEILKLRLNFARKGAGERVNALGFAECRDR